MRASAAVAATAAGARWRRSSSSLSSRFSLSSCRGSSPRAATPTSTAYAPIRSGRGTGARRCTRKRSGRWRVAPRIVSARPPPRSPSRKSHNLTLAKDGGRPVLGGNLRRRTERLAIRALALAADPLVRLDLTDDESLKTSADELLFACTDGQLKAVAASNRVVTLRGYVPDAAALERTIRALDADVPGIDRLDTSRVMVGGPAPEPKEAVEEDEPETPTPVLKKKRVPKRKLSAARPDYPVAGVLTKPYPCVVLRNGMRLCEGALIGTAEIIKIEADRLTLRESGRTFEWEP